MMRYAIFTLLSALFIFGCKDDDKVVNPAVPEISSVTAPQFLLCNAESLYTFSVRIENLEEIDSVICLVTRPDGSDELPFRLYDDAGAQTLAHPPYASEHSGDVVANNGTYTRGVWSHLLCDGEEGEYTFQFEAVKGAAHLVGDEFSVDVRAPQACDIVTSNHPTNFGLCFDPVTVSVEISEDPAVSLDTVVAMLQSGDTVLWHAFMLRTGSTDNWELDLTSSVFGCTPTGTDYTLRYEAYDRFGLSCAANYEGISFVNGLPEVSNSLLPDTMYRPESASDSNIYEMFVDVSDCEIEGWAVTQAARFDVRREDLSAWDHFPDFFLRDDGVPPDDVRGDGTASSYLKVTNNGRIDDLYYFRFYAIDCASGDTSDYLLDSTRIILEGLSALGAVETTDLGISTLK